MQIYALAEAGATVVLAEVLQNSLDACAGRIEIGIPVTLTS